MEGFVASFLWFDSPADWAGFATLVFLAILFIQSGLDKVFDHAGNLEYLSSHFSRSPFAKLTPVLLTVITILEVATGVLSLIGAVVFLISGSTSIAIAASFAATITLLSLFLGQRVAKDYAGAAALVPYFLVALAAIIFTQSM